MIFVLGHFIEKNGENMEYHYYKVIDELKKRGSSPGLQAVRGLLDVLGNPQERIRVIHIAGTNGKGSVFAFLSSILQEAGYRVGRYISPTIHSYEERFQINGKEIAPEVLEKYYASMEQAMKKMHEKGWGEPTLFEVETALSFLYFAEEQVDFALVETGMGGTLDATNVVENPFLTVIASISYDHKAFLGDTLEEIAEHKAGIIKENVPVIVSENIPEVCAVIKKNADTKKAACTFTTDRDYRVVSENVDASIFIWKKQKFSIALPGRHQISNAVTALMAAEKIRNIFIENGIDSTKISLSALQNGLASTRWPGRLELLCKEPYVFLDGAHNPDGAHKLGKFLEKHFTNRKIIYIMGVLKDKEYEKMLAELLPQAAIVYTFQPKNERGLAGEILAQCVQKANVPAECCRSVNEAVRRGKERAGKDDVVVICGSLSFIEEMEDTLWK